MKMYTKQAEPWAADLVLTAPVGTDGMVRSAWKWYRLPNGDLIFGCYPRDDLYFATEEDHSLQSPTYKRHSPMNTNDMSED